MNSTISPRLIPTQSSREAWKLFWQDEVSTSSDKNLRGTDDLVERDDHLHTKLARGERDIWIIYVFADNKSAVEQILCPKLGPSQLHAVRTCTEVQEFLDEVSVRSIQLAWCSGHVGVKDNEQVDQSAAEGTNKLQPKFISFARAKECIKTKILNEWRIKAENDPEY